jgi:hypothetical protein
MYVYGVATQVDKKYQVAFGLCYMLR